MEMTLAKEEEEEKRGRGGRRGRGWTTKKEVDRQHSIQVPRDRPVIPFTSIMLIKPNQHEKSLLEWGNK